MYWVILLVSAVLEAVWATAMGMSDGFTKLGPTIVFILTVIPSTVGLGIAAKRIAIGTAYAVWTGVGAALTVSYAMLTGIEQATLWKIVFILGIIGAVVGLKLVGEERGTKSDGDG